MRKLSQSHLRATGLILAGLSLGLTPLSLPPAAQAASVTHIYELNGSLADSLGGPSLVANGGTLGPTGYTLAANQGPSLSNAIDPATYSIEMRFSFEILSGYIKIIDFKDLTSDDGLYNLDTALDFFPVTTGPSGAFVANTITHLVLTRDDATDAVVGYVNGVQQITFTDDLDRATFSGLNNLIHFLQDDFPTGQGEASGGFLDQIRLYDGALTATQVTDLFNGAQPPGLPGQVPEPATWLMLATGLAGLLGYGWRRQRAA